MKYTCYACAIMPDHVHMLLRKHRDDAETMLDKLQATTREAIIHHSLRPADHPVWGGCGWKVYLDHPQEVWGVIRYIEDNPRKQQLPTQAWPFVTPYNNWPLHDGHSPKSPYARTPRGKRYTP